MDEISRRKRELRRTLKKKRDSLPSSYLAEASGSICLLGQEWFDRKFKMSTGAAGISRVFAYLRAGSEVDLLPLLVSISSKTHIGLPRVTSESTMEFKKWSPGDPTSMSRFSIPEPLPVAPTLVCDEQTIMLIPALAVDTGGYRLGYGGGYYDRFLSEAGPCTKIAVVYASMMEEKLLVEAHDIAVDFILTEDGMVSVLPSFN